ncbi:hypothetical protein MOBUDSM44075_00288 [Mycolicibacterium obuense]|uniref:DUF222 domain-containing protein n=1 Tax=Mycolicibacterium obuense TaxID=1807 RepID=A0A0J6ZAN0_9MYCO|nr:hypothetical protein MOBUDSM44075_00288 [Mycolicibacterium obuense]
MYVRIMSEVQRVVAGLRAAVDAVLACGLDRSTAGEVVELLDELEAAGCRLPAAQHRALARLQVETSAVQMGAKNWKDVLAIRYRISGPAAQHRALARLQVETSAVQMGAKNWKDVLAIRYRISGSEANRRLSEAALLAPRQSMTGEPLPPVLPATAAAQAQGRITPEHVEVIRKVVDKLCRRPPPRKRRGASRPNMWR